MFYTLIKHGFLTEREQAPFYIITCISGHRQKQIAIDLHSPQSSRNFIVLQFLSLC